MALSSKLSGSSSLSLTESVGSFCSVETSSLILFFLQVLDMVDSNVNAVIEHVCSIHTCEVHIEDGMQCRIVDDIIQYAVLVSWFMQSSVPVASKVLLSSSWGIVQNRSLWPFRRCFACRFDYNGGDNGTELQSQCSGSIDSFSNMFHDMRE
jgi:hypothetical protein